MDAMLAPLRGVQPCGDDLSFSAEFDAIVEMRREDDATLDQGEWITALKAADWAGVVTHCERLLAERTKDLRVACWRTEALALTRGDPGLAEGLRLVAALCRQYWDGLHPRMDGGDAEERVGALRWLLGRVQHLAAGAPRVREARSLAEALDALQELQRVVDGHLGLEGPSFMAARDALEGALHEARRVDGLTGHPADRAEQADPAAAMAGASPAGVQGRAEGDIRTREQALHRLREVAAFFRQTEPHSPVAYLAEKAAHWGALPLHLWLRQVLKDAGSLSHLEELLGVPPEAGEANPAER